MTPVLAFDIETVPDCPGIRRLYDLPEDLADAEVAEVAYQKRRAVTGNDFLPPHLQRVVVISCVLRHDDEVWIFSIGEPDTTEAGAIQRFFDGLAKYTPQIVSWNGRNFDLPVLVTRGMIHGVTAACFWDTGQDNKDAKKEKPITIMGFGNRLVISSDDPNDLVLVSELVRLITRTSPDDAGDFEVIKLKNAGVI